MKMILLQIICALLIISYSTSLYATEKNETYWKTGLLVGIIPGAVAGSIGGYYYTMVMDQCGEGPCQSPGTRTFIGSAIGLGGAVLTGAIGAGIGALIHKKDKDISILPNISPDGRSAGVMLQKSF